ncbi:vitronectin a isoform X2 [Stegastes partitus]|uniref:Vitronectin-like n=1 Tax=Stegastes partitus TaxID=144197 RepID=A0A3B5AS90_9TELE|nr:PREDICTED: vitronectin-like isoform X2 [Stegastes partitus]
MKLWVVLLLAVLADTLADARGDTFVFAEDDDDDELLGGPTATPGRPAHDQAFTAVGRQLRPTQRPILDFNHRPQQRPETTLEMTKPTQLVDTTIQRAPVTQITQVADTGASTSSVSGTTAAPQVGNETTTPVPASTTAAPDPDAEVCSGRPFDSFMQLKNGSIYAFRGEYFFELDQKTVLPGYPKLIKDVWGISGPIDAAFTRVNCQGKTYIFKGNKYWRFDNGVLDDDYPRDISVGFDKIPDHVDAAFALPAPGHNKKEKVYFFKADQYYTYEFLHQPSHEECITMSERSPSTTFRHYTDVYYNNYERYFSDLFSEQPQHHDSHHFIDKDWKGIKPPLDAAMAGRIYVTNWRSRRRDQQWGRQQDQQYQQNGRQWGQRRRNRAAFWDSMAERGMSMGQNFAERGMELGMRMAEKRMELEERLGRDWDRRWDQDWDQDRRRDRYRQNNRGNYDSREYWDYYQRDLPIQSVYFFKGDKYYRADLRTKRVDPAMPPYPRSIAKYWLGCSDTTGAEKK